MRVRIRWKIRDFIFHFDMKRAASGRGVFHFFFQNSQLHLEFGIWKLRSALYFHSHPLHFYTFYLCFPSILGSFLFPLHLVYQKWWNMHCTCAAFNSTRVYYPPPWSPSTSSATLVLLRYKHNGKETNCARHSATTNGTCHFDETILNKKDINFKHWKPYSDIDIMRCVASIIFAWIVSNHCVDSLSFPITALPKQALFALSSKYSGCLLAQPLLTNIVTASSLCILSDSISQNFEQTRAATSVREAEKKGLTAPKVAKHSWYRSFCMSVYGAIVYGWLTTYWFKFLNHVVPQEGITMALVLKKVFINQLFMSPTLNGMFFTYVTITRDFTSTFAQKIIQVQLKLKRDLIPTIKRSCVYWGIVQFINFSYIATKFQLLYTNSAFVIWTTYIAFIGFKKPEPA